MWDNSVNTLDTMWDNAVNTMDTMWDNAVNTMDTMWDNAVNTVDTMWDNAVNTMDTMWDNAVNTMDTMWDNAVNRVDTKAAAVNTKLSIRPGISSITTMASCHLGALAPLDGLGSGRQRTAVDCRGLLQTVHFNR
jgi:hypothetical protein